MTWPDDGPPFTLYDYSRIDYDTMMVFFTSTLFPRLVDHLDEPGICAIAQKKYYHQRIPTGSNTTTLDIYLLPRGCRIIRRKIGYYGHEENECRGKIVFQTIKL